MADLMLDLPDELIDRYAIQAADLGRPLEDHLRDVIERIARELQAEAASASEDHRP